MEQGLNHFPTFVEHNRQKVERIIGDQLRFVSAEAVSKSNDYESIRNSFSDEWGLFSYEGDKTWGWTLEERKRVFLEDICMKPEELTGKSLLDAGCGNGTLTAALTDFGVQVVGIDLSDRLGLAYFNRGKFSERAKENVQYIQGNLLKPPIKEGFFDIVYSSGVIHHTPNSKSAL